MADIDTSIYQNIRPPQIQTPDPLESMTRAMSLRDLALSSQVKTQAVQEQNALRTALKNNAGPDGAVNYAGAIGELMKNAPTQGMELQGHVAQMNHATMEMQQQQMENHLKRAQVFGNAMASMANLPPDKRAQVYPGIVQQLTQQGVIEPTQNVPSQYNDDFFNRTLMMHYQTKDAIDARLKQAEAAKNFAEAKKAESETFRRPTDIAGVTDPAKLVPALVPKDHQAKAFAEIDAAENTKRMSSSIMDAFDQASKENTVLKTGYVPDVVPFIGGKQVRTPPSVLALHQALQPTFKDLEGTVRQAAMDNTFKNVTPAPGDTDATVATKRQALEQYLQSKASAPTARGYGIDLSKYDSTAAYQGKRDGAPQVAGSNLIPSANASQSGATPQVAPAPHPQDSQAVSWAKANPKDPRAAKILQLNGVR